MTKKIILTVLALIIVALPILTYQWIHRGERQIFANEGYKIGAMTLDEQGRVWACYEGDDGQSVGIFQIDKLITSNKVSGDDASICNAIVVDKQENIWVNYPTAGELRMFDGESWTTVTNTESDSILTVDHSGNIWIGSTSRLEVFDVKSWNFIQLDSLYSTESSLGGANFNAIAFDDKDRVWIGTSGIGTSGLYIFDGKEWQFPNQFRLASTCRKMR
jgi:ligand-binding sensor domain-containing protein